MFLPFLSLEFEIDKDDTVGAYNEEEVIDRVWRWCVHRWMTTKSDWRSLIRRLQH